VDPVEKLAVQSKAVIVIESNPFTPPPNGGSLLLIVLGPITVTAYGDPPPS